MSDKAIHLMRTGHQWRALPNDFSRWRTTHSYWATWSEPREGGSLLEQALKNQVGAAQEKQRRNACSMFLIVNAQSVKNTDTARARMAMMQVGACSKSSNLPMISKTTGKKKKVTVDNSHSLLVNQCGLELLSLAS